jgi:23S rRNA pseudouridine2605 synthase
MLARLGHKVLNLRRIAIGPVQLKALARGKARRLSAEELAGLRRAAHTVKTPSSLAEEDGVEG